MSSSGAENWMHVGLSGDGIELYINGEDASVSPNGRQVHVRIGEKQGHLLLGMLQEKLEMKRRLKALMAAQAHAGDAT